METHLTTLHNKQTKRLGLKSEGETSERNAYTSSKLEVSFRQLQGVYDYYSRDAGQSTFPNLTGIRASKQPRRVLYA